MTCVVYVLRRAGKRLPLDVVKSKPHLGWLFMGQDARKDIPEQAVRLFRSRGQRDDVMAPIVHPRLAKIDRGGAAFHRPGRSALQRQPEAGLVDRPGATS